MLDDSNRPIVCAIHPKLVEEFKERKKSIEAETGRPTKGGMTTFSEMCAYELYLIRMSGEKIKQEVLKIKNINIKKIVENGIEKNYVPYELFKRLLVLSSILSKKKDINQIKLDVSKIKGINKNEVKFTY